MLLTRASTVSSDKEPMLSKLSFVSKLEVVHWQVCICAVSRTDLQPWQILKLDSAYETGRRHVKARINAKNVGLAFIIREVLQELR